MERILSAIERTAGLALALVAILIFLTAFLRYLFSVNLPDGFDLSRYLQGIAIVWGLAVTTYRGGHICVDVIWEIGGPRLKRAIDVVANTLTALFFCAFAWVLVRRLPSIMSSSEFTNDLHLSIWPFFAACVAGAIATALVSVVVLLRTFTARPQEPVPHG